jgi:type I restriction enzyme S subunit
MRLPKYAKYKESDAPWLGQVPAHWECVRLASLFREVGDPGNDDLPILSVSIHDGVSDKELGEEEADRKVSRSDDRSKYKAVAPGDLTYNMMRAWQGGFGTVAVPGMVSPAYVVARPTAKFVTSHIELLLRTPMAVTEMKRHSRGITDFRLRLYWEDFKCIRIALPPHAEQLAIADFLGGETAKIDALIAEQEKLIALLAEKRQATISRAVTKGLDPNAPMKDSGVAWGGEVPAHWEVQRIKRLVTSIEQGWSPQCENFPVSSAEEWGVLKVGCVNGGAFQPAENKKLPPELEPVPAYSLRRGDLLISRANTRDLVGSAAAIEADFANLMLCDKLYRLRLAEDLCAPPYLAAYLGTPQARSQIELQATGASSSMLNIGQSAILDLFAPVPSSAEQVEILQFLSHETKRLDALNACAEQAIALLKERRSALIAAAVTGQIDVRNA